MNYDWDFSVLTPYIPALQRGVLITIELSVIGSLLGTIVGFALGILYRLKPLDRLLLPLNDALRAIPLLVLIFFIYYFPYTEILGIAAPSAFACALIALAVAQAVYTADIVRAAVDGVSKGSIMGARSLGLQEKEIWWHIILPDIFRQILPSLIGFFIGTVRLSSLSSVIGCEDVVFVARSAISQRFRSLEAWIVVSLIYIALVLPLAWVSRYIEKSKWLKRR
jgi:His/Glu/Gln/Arg/opine family amino acid ABC transporter permease subunit